MNLDVEDCMAFARRELTHSRFEHSLGVMQVMDELASIYTLDHTTALVCGILHDAAKELPVEDQIELARENNISLNAPCDGHPMFLHGPAGACYITQELGISDPMILDAITRHSYFGTGVALSPVLCWCLRFADVLEPKRDWEELRMQPMPLVYSGKLKEGAFLLMKWIIPFLKTKSVPAHPNMHKVLNELSTLMAEENFSETNRFPI